jgi:hypothetical protein
VLLVVGVSRGLRCPAPQCSSKVDHELVRSVVSEELWLIYEKGLLGKCILYIETK